MAHPRKPPYRRKNFTKISYASRVIVNFVPNFIAMAMGIDQGKMQLAAFDGPSPKTPLQAQKYRKNSLRKPSYSQFCPKFRCGVGRGKMQLAAFDGPSPKTPYMCKNFLRKPSYSQFCPKFRCHGNQGGSKVKLYDTIRFAIPVNHTLEPKITTLSYTQPKL